MAWFILTSREFFPFLTPLGGVPSPFTNSFCSPPAFSRWSSANPILGVWDPSRIFSTMTYFSCTLYKCWGCSRVTFVHNWIFYTEVSWKAESFNLYRGQLESRLSGEEQRDKIEIMGRAYSLKLHYKHRDLRNLYSTENPPSLESDFNFISDSKKVILINERKCSNSVAWN